MNGHHYGKYEKAVFWTAALIIIVGAILGLSSLL
jgi:hypothetical protein